MKKRVVCVAGKNNVAVRVAEYLFSENNERYELVVCCNRNDLGENTWQLSLKKWAFNHKIKILQLDELYEIEDLIFLSVEFDRIIKTKKFKTKNLYNIHFSLLPQYRGMYTSALPIINGESCVGVTLHEIDDGIDTGRIIEQWKFALDKKYTARDLYFRYMYEGSMLIMKNIENILSEKCISYQQSEQEATYYSKEAIDYSNICINLNCRANQIDNQIRAFTFREYQLPQVYGESIVGTYITNEQSTRPSGSIVEKNYDGIKISTIDYDMWLYFDKLDELLVACRIGDMNSVRKICSIPCHINQNEIVHGWTPLMVATYYNQIEIVEYLLENGADYKAINYNGTNLLMYAKDVILNYNDSRLFELYLKLGVKPTQEDYTGKTLYDYIKENDEIKKYIEHKVDVF